MESLQVRTGQISLQILDDYGEVRGVFKFNPQDIESAKRVFALQAELPSKQAEFEARIETVTDDNDKMEVLSDIVDYFNNAIDECFGKGSVPCYSVEQRLFPCMKISSLELLHTIRKLERREFKSIRSVASSHKILTRGDISRPLVFRRYYG